MKTKPVPTCPVCDKEMSKTGTLNRGELKPKRIFSCMAFDCPNNRRYFRDGTEAK